MGDGVYELLARTHVARRGPCRVQALHGRTVAWVSAQAQAQAVQAILPMLNEEELAVFQRGRNAKPKTVPRHARGEDYALATGLEALLGYLYLTGENGRISELWQAILLRREGGGEA